MTFTKNTIFFEYGAESGSIVPPWDEAGAGGSGSTEGAGVVIDDTYVRTGDHSLELFQPAPPKSDAQRRIEIGLYGTSHNQNEFYFSWWMYFPSGFEDVVQDNEWGPVLGGTYLYWGNPNSDPQWQWSKGLRFRFIVTPYGAGGFTVFPYLSGHDSTGANPALSDYEVSGWSGRQYPSTGEWHHFQIYFKQGDMNTGRIAAWIDNNLCMDETTATHPSYFGEKESSDIYSHYTDIPSLALESYCSQDTPAHEIWVDDVVASTQKVSENYGVINK